jgi:hypothetical protein
MAWPKQTTEQLLEIAKKRKATIEAKQREQDERFQRAVEDKVARILAQKTEISGLAAMPVEEAAKIEEKVAVDMKQKSTTPWKPFKRLKIPTEVKDQRFHYHFADTTRDGNELGMLNEGWEYDTDIAQKLKDRNLAPKRPLKDGSGLDGTYKVNELVLMRIPIEDYEEHQKYYRAKGKIDKETMKHDMRQQIGSEGAHEEAKVYTDSFGVQGLNQEKFG